MKGGLSVSSMCIEQVNIFIPSRMLASSIFLADTVPSSLPGFLPKDILLERERECGEDKKMTPLS